MGGLFDKPKAIKPILPVKTPPVPTVGEEVGTQARRRRPRGRRETFLTGDLIPMLDIEKKQRLG